MKITFQLLTMKHAAIAQYLREADKKEIEDMAASVDIKLSETEAVEYSIRNTKSGFAAFIDGELTAIFGVTKETDESGNIWLLGTDEITKRPLRFYKESKSIFDVLSKGYDELYNYVGKKNKTALRWLEWLGFKFEEAGEPFEDFVLVRWTRPCAP
ncbi:hypothetical protein FACS1894187_05050 [Synergistales bacterium]|nr:hypothetical protein FACS1894187_05050 [Synergistales bacterium]